MNMAQDPNSKVTYHVTYFDSPDAKDAMVGFTKDHLIKKSDGKYGLLPPNSMNQ
jgi:hypothetical protein